MEGFFDEADMVFKTAIPAPLATTQGVPTKALIPSTELIPIGGGTYMKGISETAPIPVETFTPQKGVVPSAIVQTEFTSLAIPLVISTSDPFVALSQVVKDGSSLVVTPSSIPSSTTCKPDVDLSSEGSEDVLEYLDDEPTMKKRVFDFEEEESVEHEAEFMGMCLFIFFSFLLPPFFFFFSYLVFIHMCLCHPLLWSPFILYVHSFDCGDL